MRKKRSLRKTVLLSIGTMLATVLTFGGAVAGTYLAEASIAHDDRFLAFGMKETVFTVPKFDNSVSPYWNVSLVEAVADWNDAHPEVDITIQEPSSNKILFTDLPRRALYTKVCIPFSCHFVIAINKDYETEGKDWILEEGKFLLIHELGHALGINDFEETPDGQVSAMSAKMNYGIPKVSMYDTSLLMQRISRQRELTQGEIIAQSLEQFITPVYRALNGYSNK